MREEVKSNNSIKALQWGMHDAIVNGVLQRDIPTRLIFVANSTERDALKNIAAGTFVTTYDLTNIWNYKGDGSWATIK